MDSDEQNNFYFHTPHSLPSSSHSSSSYGHSYTPLQGGFNHSRSSLEPIAQPFPTRHGHLWPHSTTPTERSWTSSPLTDGITSAGPRNTTQFQSSLLSEEVQKKLDRARERITYLEGQLETITASFNKVIDKVPELLRLETPRPDAKFAVMAALGQRPKKRNAEDYPDVRFWTLASWKKYQEMRKGISNSEKLTNHFLEDEDGRALDKHQVESIHKVAFSLWFMVRDAKRLPVTWGVAAADVSDFFRDEMVRRCPDMLLCEDDWKTTYLATQIYSSWKRSHGTKKVKEEAGEMSIAEEQKPGLSKRKVEDPVTGNLIVPSKKPKQSKETTPAALVPTSVPTQSISLLKSNTLTDGTGKPAATAQHVQTTASVDNASAPTTVGRPTPRRLQLTGTLFPSIPTTNHGANPNTVNEPTVNAASGTTASDKPAVPAQSLVPVPNPVPLLNPVQNPVPAPPTLIPLPVNPAQSPSIPAPALGLSNEEVGSVLTASLMRPTKTKSARGICSSEWCAANPNGTKAEFASYWNSIKATPEATRFVMAASKTTPQISTVRKTTRSSAK